MRGLELLKCYQRCNYRSTINVQVDRPGLPSNTVRPSMPGSATDESKQQLQYQLDEGVRRGGRERAGRYLMENGRLTYEDGMGGDEEEELMRELSISNHAKESLQLSTSPPLTQSVTFLAREVCCSSIGPSTKQAIVADFLTLLSLACFRKQSLTRSLEACETLGKCVASSSVSMSRPI